MVPGVVLQFALATLLPVAATAAVCALGRTQRFSRLSNTTRQVLIGLLFGVIAIFGTEFGIDVDGATMNVRDAAPISAGLVFGGPAGIIAGVIGGVERWLSVLWGRGTFTQLGCTIATIIAGIYAVGLRRYVFDNKKPWWAMAFAVGVVGEVLHLTLIFFTNTNELERAIGVVRACSAPMITCNGISVLLAVVVATLVSHEPLQAKAEHRSIARSVQAGMLIGIVLGFIATSGLIYAIQTGMSDEQTSELLSLNIEDAKADVSDLADSSLLRVARTVADEVGSVAAGQEMDLHALAKSHGVCEIDLVDTQGTVVGSTEAAFVGYDMASADQSASFLVLLDGSTKQYVQEYRRTGGKENLWRKYAGIALEDGFMQVAYDGEQLQGQIAEQVAIVARNRRVGEGGGIVVVNSQDAVVGARSSIVGSSLAGSTLADDLRHVGANTMFLTTLDGVRMFALYQRVEGYRVVAVQPESEARFGRDATVLLSVFMEVIVFAALFVIIYSIVKRLVVDNVRRLNSTLDTICGGDLDAQAGVRSSEEFASLSDGINHTVSALKFVIHEAETRFDTDLEYARTIQRSALPMVFPPYPSRNDFQVFASMDAAKEVGGDFYDFYLLDDERLAFLVADVSGKGIPAAMFMMTAKTLLKSLMESGLPVEEAMRRGNDRLCEGNDAEMFVTVWMGVLDTRTGHVTYANAGHNPPVLLHGTEDPTFVKVRPNMVLAGMDGIPYRAHELNMSPGDVLFLYTDGVTEATDNNNQLFGDERLLEGLARHRSRGVEDICRGIRAEVDAFVDGAPQFDDITMLALKYMGGDRDGA